MCSLGLWCFLFSGTFFGVVRIPQGYTALFTQTYTFSKMCCSFVYYIYSLTYSAHTSDEWVRTVPYPQVLSLMMILKSLKLSEQKTEVYCWTFTVSTKWKLHCTQTHFTQRDFTLIIYNTQKVQKLYLTRSNAMWKTFLCSIYDLSRGRGVWPTQFLPTYSSKFIKWWTRF